MAGSSLLLLIDDIATILDDVSVMAKVAAKKTGYTSVAKTSLPRNTLG